MKCDAKMLCFYNTVISECPSPATTQLVVIDQASNNWRLLNLCDNHAPEISKGWIVTRRVLP